MKGGRWEARGERRRVWMERKRKSWRGDGGKEGKMIQEEKEEDGGKNENEKRREKRKNGRKVLAN